MLTPNKRRRIVADAAHQNEGSLPKMPTLAAPAAEIGMATQRAPVTVPVATGVPTACTARITRVHSCASFSADGIYRYSLLRSWGVETGHGDEADDTSENVPASNSLLFIGLNPSTADAARDDPTIRRCIGFAKQWGHDSLVVCNLFALRSTHPSGLRAATDPVGRVENDRVLATAARGCTRILCGWGNGLIPGAAAPMMRRRVSDVLALLREVSRPERLCCLHITNQQQPQHPLYVKADTRPRRMPEYEDEQVREPHTSPCCVGTWSVLRADVLRE